MPRQRRPSLHLKSVNVLKGPGSRKNLPRLEEYLAPLPEPEHRDAGHAAGPGDALPAARGETIVLDEYLQRFPADIEPVNAVFLTAGFPAGLHRWLRSPRRSRWTRGPPTTSGGTEIPFPRAATGSRPGLVRDFGVVYKGYDEDLRREVAIKVPYRHRVASPEDAETYMTEAHILASLDHPGIVPVYDVGHTEDGLCHVVSKLIAGSDLKKRLKQGRP